MKILFAPQAGAVGIGGITRCLAIAEEATLRGHVVAFLTPEHYPLLDSYSFGRRFIAPLPKHDRNFGVGEAESFAQSIAIRGMADSEYVKNAVVTEIAAIEEFSADVVVTENQPTIPISAQAVGVPFVSTVATINLQCFGSQIDVHEQLEQVHETFRAACRRYHLKEPRDLETLLHGHAALNIAPTAEFLEPCLASVPNVRFVGPLLFAPVELAPVEMQPQGETNILAARGRSSIFTKRTESVQSGDLGSQIVSDRVLGSE